MFHTFETYLEAKGSSKNTIRSYVSDIKNCVKHCIISENMASFVPENFYEAKISASTKNRWYNAVVSYANFCIQAGLIEKSPITEVMLPKVHKKIPKVADGEAIKDTIDSTEDKEIALILSILYCTGCRIDSLANLQIEDIQNDKIVFNKTKGDKAYVSFLDEVTRMRIKLFIGIKSNGPLFVNREGKQHTADSIRLKLKRGLKDKYINPHSIRHSIATTLVSNGADVYAVQQFLNHSSVTTTQRYIHLSNDDRKKKLKSFHPMLND